MWYNGGMINQITREKIEVLAKRYRELALAQPQAVRELWSAILPEMVYNSNAIENSTLTLDDTEDILMRDKIRTDHAVREIYEAKNLAKAMEYLDRDAAKKLSTKMILDTHRILLTDIRDDIAGRWRSGKEWVRVGTHIGANPEFVAELMQGLVDKYNADNGEILDKIAYFHAEFENIHPFGDGNGRMGRLITNWQLAKAGLPPIIVANKSKYDEYYPALEAYVRTDKCDEPVELFAKLLIEALHRWIAMLTAKKIIPLAEWARQNGEDVQATTNKAARGTIPGFRVRDHWMIDAGYKIDKSN